MEGGQTQHYRYDVYSVYVLTDVSSRAVPPPFKKRRPKKANGYWADPANKKRFLCAVAEELGFDPYNLENWKSVSRQDLCSRKARILRSVQHLVLTMLPQGYGLFSHYCTVQQAAEDTFLPTNQGMSLPESWRYYDISYHMAVAEGKEKRAQGARKKKRGYWQDWRNRRRFFSEYAARKGFDPLNAANWAKVTYREIVADKVRQICLSA